MSFQERQLAQIVRDFMEAYDLAEDIASSLYSGDLEFEAVRSLVSESEHSALYRLKEETHALFRFDQTASKEELQAEELFDLAVGALFHEAMRFREGYYLTTQYGPRLDSMMQAGVARGPLAISFRRAFEAGRQRMRESAAESRELFDETRDQLLIVLQHLPNSRAVARSLVENPALTERVFGESLRDLLASIFGSASKGYRLALDGLIESGHFGTALHWLERDRNEEIGAFRPGELSFIRGMKAHYEGSPSQALDHLEQWILKSDAQPCAWRRVAARAIEYAVNNGEAELTQRGAELARALRNSPEQAAGNAETETVT